MFSSKVSLNSHDANAQSTTSPLPKRLLVSARIFHADELAREDQTYFDNVHVAMKSCI